ncbi:unnamed protein product [Euphydryas editha]|uniref:Aprataxin and PNK-like factor n=1 Tax=Euphydryas editha TaxID=104508 RepID=A0AAU9TWR1_EUPED|nr:unnamed protein product [Euphydryas editha]
MPIKLIRTDAIECAKIQLHHGEHIIGRGKLLDCNDKRISREHGEVLVNEDSITIKALHQNPFFFIKKGSIEAEILRQGNSITLTSGDRFGLLPDTYWYEVLHCLELVETEGSETQKCTEEYPLEEVVNDENAPNSDKVNDKDNSEIIDFNNEETINNDNGPESPSLISNKNGETDRQQRLNEPVIDNVNEPTSSNVVLNEPKCENEDGSSNNTSPPVKRSHSPDVGDVKKIKTEDVKVKVDPDGVKPGPSDQAASANVNNAPPSNNQPNRPRERCMYGANCYRRNPQHKDQFSHPSDADWGPGERGVCPYGVRCDKRDFRHWRDHDHPPGVLPPPRPGMQVVEKRGNVFFINAHTVNFYDDHFQVEDEDGDSVDYDYEF